MIDPVAFSLFGFDVRWYGLAYVIGFLFGYWFLMKFGKDFGFKNSFLEDAALWFILSSVIGGRIFYILFYNLSFYLQNPIEIIRFDHGGMSIHGGIFFGALALYYVAKKHKKNYLKLWDLFSIPASLALAFGRLANFVNQEVVGKPTNSSLGLVFPKVDEQTRWPTQLFEGFKNMLTFQVLLYLYFFKELKPGIITAWFLILYNGLRFVIDFLRESTVSLQIISMGQLLSLVFMFFGIYLLKKSKLYS